MIELKSSLDVENPAQALKDQDGIFEVTSPHGHVFRVICRKGSSMRVREIGESKESEISEPRKWRIQRMNRGVA